MSKHASSYCYKVLCMDDKFSLTLSLSSHNYVKMLFTILLIV